MQKQYAYPLLYRQTEHYAGSQLDEVDLQYLAYEWERTAGTYISSNLLINL